MVADGVLIVPSYPHPTHVISPTVRLTLLGMFGVLAIAPAIPDIIRRALPPGKAHRLPMPALVVAAAVQTSALVLLSAWIGVRFGAKVGMHSWIADGVISSAPSPGALFQAIVVAIAIGATGGFVAHACAPALTVYFGLTPLHVRVLYGGLTEEVLVRWGLLAGLSATLLATLHEQSGLTAVVLSNALFSVAHLPALRAGGVHRSARAPLVIFAVTLPWGWLCLRYGLEAAVIAHVSFHLAAEVRRA